jgi:hypothetical protein
MPPPSSVRKPVPAPASGPGSGISGVGNGVGPSRARDVLLQNNPDFEIPGMRPLERNFGSSKGEGGGGAPGKVGMGMQPPPVPPANGLTGVGRYPQP